MRRILAVAFCLCLSASLKTGAVEPAALRAARLAYAEQNHVAEMAYHKALAAAGTKLLTELTATLERSKDVNVLAALGPEIKRLKEQIAVDTAISNNKVVTLTVEADKSTWRTLSRVNKGLA